MANEKRLIDANALRDTCRTTLMVDVFPNWRNMPDNEKNVAVKLGGAFRRIHDNAPTVDAVEVVQGRWIKQGNIFKCSSCACCVGASWNYCPNCGAKMDGGNEDG